MKRILLPSICVLLFASFISCKKDKAQEAEVAPIPTLVTGSLWESDYQDAGISYNNVMKFMTVSNLEMYILLSIDLTPDKHTATYELKKDSLIISNISSGFKTSNLICLFNNSNVFTSNWGLEGRLITFKRFIIPGTSWKNTQVLENNLGTQTKIFNFKYGNRIEIINEVTKDNEVISSNVSRAAYTLDYPNLTVNFMGKSLKFTFIDSRTIKDLSENIKLIKQ